VSVQLVGIIGTGLIGSSVGLRARAKGYRVLGHDADTSHAQQAAQLGAIDSIADVARIHAECPIVVIAVPVRATCTYLASIDRAAPPRARLLMDVASVKAPIVRASHGLHHFVASHPMAGKETTGPGAADANLFESRPWLYVRPHDVALEQRAIEFIRALGGRPFGTAAAEHDAMLALSSHMPQLLAYIFADQMAAAGNAEHVLPYCGPAARELLRLGRSPLTMWQEIFDDNAANVARVLRELAARLQRKADSLEHHTDALP